MLVAHHLASQALPKYTSRFSRHDFTLPQLLACLAVKELLRRSYRAAEVLLRDAKHWCRAIGMRKVPDHNTLCRASAVLLNKLNVNQLLDAIARWAALNNALGLSLKPLAGDSTHFESRHVSRHYEKRCATQRWRWGRKYKIPTKDAADRARSRTLKRLPKLAVGVACATHLILSGWCGIGAGSDAPHFEQLLFDAWRRVPLRCFTAVLDAGFDSEANHQIARHDMGIRSIMPPRVGRPSEKPPTGWRLRMKHLLRSKRSRQRCRYTQRAQAETVVSMIKRNLGSELSGKTNASRKRDMRLKILTHDLMIIRRQQRVETEPV